MSTPFTDIVIPVHNALPDLQECLSTLQATTAEYRLIFVDDASAKDTSEYLYNFCCSNPSAVMIRTSKQRWFTRASNLGLRLVRTDRCVLLNSDCVMGAGWLDELFAVWGDFQAQCPNKQVGLVGSVMSDEEPRRWVESVNQDYVTGHCWLVSMAALSDISCRRGMPGWYLDELKPSNAHIRSDVEATWDLNRAGYATIKSFKSPVGHKGGRSWGYNLGAISGLQPRDLDMCR